METLNKFVEDDDVNQPEKPSSMFSFFFFELISAGFLVFPTTR